ncbi:HPr family phosphocarrier protein [Paenibacillus soyae]|uniref:Phosphocarrier protein HPr n=1 Tax=Paenibacillus soyae TaxID=2969249 RepID=A0A9X2SA82_9BACL|nr:HPr family phosphocarrier protein [Paenibacillus soyae]MCR2804323.1 HPr family phosphocarrier protein [Paenibacillus soyae]
MKKQFTIQNPFGLQPSPVRHITHMAKAYPLRVSLEIEGKRYDAKSLVQLLSAEAKFGDIVTVSAEEGAAAAEVVDAIGSLLTKVGPSGPAG